MSAATAASPSADPMRRRAVQVDTARLLPRLAAALEACQPQTRGELMHGLGITDIEANVALDRAQTAGELSRRVLGGRIVYHLPDWTPPHFDGSAARPAAVIVALTAPADAPDAPGQPGQPGPIEAAAAPAAEGSEAADAAPLPGSVSAAILGALAGASSPLHLGLAFAEAAELKPNTLKNALQRLKAQGLVTSSGARRGTRWQLTDAGRAAVTLTLPPAAAAETAPDTAAATDAFEPAADELLAWHADAAEREAARRAQARADRPVFGDLNDLLLGHAFRNDAALPMAVAVAIDVDARYALWSDGRLQIEAGDAQLTFSPAAARGLIHYLDRLTGEPA